MPIPPKNMRAFMDQQGKREGPPVPNAADDAGEDDPQTIVQQAVADVQDGSADEDVIDLMTDYDPEAGRPEWALDEDVWSAALEAVNPAGRDDLDDPYLVVALVYKRMGGEIVGGEQSEIDADDDAEGNAPPAAEGEED